MTVRTPEQYAAKLSKLSTALTEKVKPYSLLDGPAVYFGEQVREDARLKNDDSTLVAIFAFGTDEEAKKKQLDSVEQEIKNLGWNVEADGYEVLEKNGFSVAHYNVSPSL